MSTHIFEVSAILYFFGVALVWGVYGSPRALAKNEDGRSSFPPGVVLLISLCALAPLLPGCSGEERETFGVEQRSEYPIPGLHDVRVAIGDIELGAIQSLRILDAAGKELAQDKRIPQGGAIGFVHGGRRYSLIVDKIDYHFRGTDFAFFYLQSVD
ncbi:MAG: hypothetical protein ACREU8_03900 [Gammaproteobacteria bacterium]